MLLVFIMQNTDSTTVNFFGWQWNLPVGVAILLAAVCGGLLTVAVGTARIVQLRRAAKKNLKSQTLKRDAVLREIRVCSAATVTPEVR